MCELRLDGVLGSSHENPIDSLSLFSDSAAIVRLFRARRLSQHNLILSFPSPEKVPTCMYEGIIRAEHDVPHRSNCVFSPYSPKYLEVEFSEVRLEDSDSLGLTAVGDLRHTC
jgi:hypothetical protein